MLRLLSVYVGNTPLCLCLCSVLDATTLLSSSRLTAELEASIVALYNAQRGTSKLFCAMVSALPESDSLSSQERSRLRKKFQKLCGPEGRLNPAHKRQEWSPAEDKQLLELAEENVPWSDMKQRFTNRSANELRDRASAISPTHKKFQRCAYGLSTGIRCSSTRAQAGLVFQKVSDLPKVLSHMCIAPNDYSVHLRCCALHGQNTSVPLSATNLPDHTAVLAKRARVRPDPSDREQQQSERHVKAEAKREDRARLAARATCLAGHHDDPGEAIDYLLGVKQENERHILELKETARVAQEDEKAARMWMSSFRPETWNDVDDTWINLWTPFRDKTV